MKEHRLAGLHQMHLAGFGVGEDHGAHQHRQHLIRAKDGAKTGGMAKAVAGWQAKDQLVDLSGRDIDPVIDLPRLKIAPDMPGGGGIGDGDWPIKHRTGRGFIGHGSLRRVVKVGGDTA